MFQFYTGFLLILYFTLSISIDPNKSSSKLIYNSNSNHDLRFDKNNSTKKNDELVMRKSRQQVLNEHLRVIIIIGSISVGIMFIIVSTYITIQYFRNKRRNNPETAEQTVPLNTSKQKLPKPRMVSITTTT